MTIRSTLSAAALIAAATVAPLATVIPATVAAAQTAVEVPPREQVSPAVTYYTPLRPQIATAGLLLDGAAAELKGLGFTSVLDLRGPQEGSEAERSALTAAGLRYFNIPFTAAAVTEPQLVEFARIVEDKSNYPLMIHCNTANRVGAMWTLYRTVRGAPFAVAVSEGRVIGLKPDRESVVRVQLGQPPLGR
jgi:uncharacterized protein (TIGR01244 family)